MWERLWRCSACRWRTAAATVTPAGSASCPGTRTAAGTELPADASPFRLDTTSPPGRSHDHCGDQSQPWLQLAHSNYKFEKDIINQTKKHTIGNECLPNSLTHGLFLALWCHEGSSSSSSSKSLQKLAPLLQL